MRYLPCILLTLTLLSCRTTDRPDTAKKAADPPSETNSDSADSQKPRWSEPQLLSSDVGHFSKDITVMQEPQGAVHIFWPSASLRDWLWVRFDGKSWQPTETLVSIPSSSNFRIPTGKMANDGEAVFLWTEELHKADPTSVTTPSITYSRFFSPGKGWGAISQVSSENEEGYFLPNVGIMSGGNGLVCYDQIDRSAGFVNIWVRKFKNAQWQAPEKVAPEERAVVNGGILCDVSESGDYLLHWMGRSKENDKTLNASAITGRINGASDSPTILSSLNNSSGALKAFLDSQGHGFTFWYGNGSENGTYTYYGNIWSPDSRSWSQPAPLFAEMSGGLVKHSIVENNHREVWGAFAPSFGGKRRIIVRRFDKESGWEDAGSIDPDSHTAIDEPFLVFDDKNQLSVLYTKNSHLGWRLWWSHYRNGIWQKPEQLPALKKGDANRHSLHYIGDDRWLVIWRQKIGDTYHLWYSVFN